MGCTALDGEVRDGTKAWLLQLVVSAETAE